MHTDEFTSRNIESGVAWSRTSYEVMGQRVTLEWKDFLPQEQPPFTKVNFEPKNLKVYSETPIVSLLGWTMYPQAEMLKDLHQTLSTYARAPVYAIKARIDRSHPNSAMFEAAAVKRFTEDMNFGRVNILGTSLGGLQATHAAVACEKSGITVQKIVLVDSMGLYDQSLFSLMFNYGRDLGETQLRVLYRAFMKSNNPVLRFVKKTILSDTLPQPPYINHGEVINMQHWRYMRDSVYGLLKDIAKTGIIGYPRKLAHEIQQMISVNESARKITAPVVLIHGIDDYISRPHHIIPDGKGGIENDFEIRQALISNLYPLSSDARIIVASKLGNHDLSIARGKSTGIAIAHFVS